MLCCAHLPAVTGSMLCADQHNKDSSGPTSLPATSPFGWSGDEAKPPMARHSVSLAEKTMAELDKSKAVELLNRILEAELAGVVRYTHYSLLVLGFNRIPIVAYASKPPSHWPLHSRPERWSRISASIPPLAIGPLRDTTGRTSAPSC